MNKLRVSVLAGFVGLASSGIGAAQQPAEPRETDSSPRIGLRVEGGLVAMHGGAAGAGGVHVIRAFDARQLNRLEAGFFADQHSFSADAGIDLRAPIRSRLAVLLRGGGGMIFEPDWRGPFFRLGGGIEWRYTPDVAMALTVQSGVHGDVPGPHRIMVGLERSFGN